MKITKIGTWNSLERKQKFNNENTGTQKKDFVSPSFGVVMAPEFAKEMKAASFLQALKEMSTDVLRGKLAVIDETLAGIEAVHKVKIQEIKDWHKITSPFKNFAMKNATEQFAKDYQKLLYKKDAILDEFNKRTGNFKAISEQAIYSTDPMLKGAVKSDKAYRTENQAKEKFYNQKGFASIAGYDKEKHLLNNDIIAAIKSERKGEIVDVPGAILFFGPQGNGKSTFAEAFAYESGARVVSLESSGQQHSKEFYKSFLEKLYKEAGKAKKLFETEGDTKNQRTVLIIDEFDYYAGSGSKILPQLEEFLEKCSKDFHCTVFATTNYPQDIKLPMKKDSVFPYRVGMDPASVEDKAKILEFYMAPRATKSVDYKNAVARLLEREKETGNYYGNARLRRIALEGNPSETGLLAMIEKLTPDITSKQYAEYQAQVAKLSKGKTVL